MAAGRSASPSAPLKRSRGGRRPGRPRISRRERERELARATKALFDERGLRDAQIEDVARAVGINKALIYRHFSSKEELYVHTVLLYLEELEAAFSEIEAPDNVARLLECSRIFAGYGLDHPAFLDCCLALIREPQRELRETVSDAVLFRLGQRMAACLAVISGILRDGARSGEFEVEDPDLVANFLYTATLGALHLPRSGVGVRRGTQGLPELFPISDQQVEALVLEQVLAAVGVARDDPRVDAWWASREPVGDVT